MSTMDSLSESSKGKVVDYDGDHPRVITLCGSTRFKEYFEWSNLYLTLQGNLVFSCAWFGHSDKEFEITDEHEVLLNEFHKRKIDLSDEIVVLDVYGYIGDSTKSEIEYAERHGKKITYLSQGSDGAFLYNFLDRNVGFAKGPW